LRQGKAANAQGDAMEGHENAEAMQVLKLHTIRLQMSECTYITVDKMG